MMKTVYYPDDDILELHFSDNPVAKETAQDWNLVLSYDADNHLVQMVILDASKSGLLPFQELKAA
jgi:carotenoid cleavage dioxygenase-like enzyme